jgi:hypothetical protein
MVGCSEAAIARLEDRHLCYQHFLARSYERLEIISAKVQDRQIHQRDTESEASFLEDCMRDAADIACAVTSPP